MATEIERKFLVKNDRWRSLGSPRLYCQGYLAQGLATVRVRIVETIGYLTIKGKTEGMSRSEFEYPIPLADAQALLALCERPLIEKYRYTIADRGFVWEVDEFLGDNAGLVIAEVELQTETDAPPLPDWIGEEVTGDPRYYNANLVRNPFSQW